ncbi:MAG: alpha/beta fold hydrolase [Anaerorhabdus sp.]
MKKRLKQIGILIVGLILIGVGAFFIYTQDYYHADEIAQAYFERGIDEGKYTVFSSDSETSIGFIFYPGGKVEEEAYAPLMQMLSDKGIETFLFEMPFNLAVFDINAATNAIENHPEISQWYIGGHSLGGAMAASFAEKNEDQIAGLILLGAYPSQPMLLPTLILVGEHDEVINRKKLEGFIVDEIAGGNHAFFGYYGEQSGDGTATITREKQQETTTDEIVNFISSME